MAQTQSKSIQPIFNSVWEQLSTKWSAKFLLSILISRYVSTMINTISDPQKIQKIIQPKPSFFKNLLVIFLLNSYLIPGAKFFGFLFEICSVLEQWTYF